MKRLYTWLLAAALPALAAADGLSVPYETDFSDQDWTIHNVNADEQTWTINNSASDYNGTGFSAGIKYRWNSSQAANDWIISPAIQLEAGKNYKVTYWYKGASPNYHEKVGVYMSTGSDLASFTSDKLLNDHETTDTQWHKGIKKFTVDADGDYYFGIYCHSDKDRMNLFFTGFAVSEDVFRPGPVTGLAITPGADHALEAKLTWALPTVDDDGGALADDATFEAIHIYRDGVLVSTPDLAADATEWTDNAASGLTSGKHTYAVEVVVNGATSRQASAQSSYIGPIAPQSIPFDAGLCEPGVPLPEDEFTMLWLQARGRTSHNTNVWKPYTSASVGTKIQFYVGTTSAADEWLMSPEINFPAPGVYKLHTILDFSPYSAEYEAEFLIGTGSDIGGYTTSLGSTTEIGSSKPFDFIFEVAEAGPQRIALHFTSETCYNNLYINDFTVEAWHKSPAQVSDLAATVSADRSSVNVTWKYPSVNNAGGVLESITKAEVSMDGEVVATLTDCVPGADGSYTCTPEENGVHTFSVLPYLGEYPADGTVPEVKSSWVGPENQALPYTTGFDASDATTLLWGAVDADNDGTTFTYSQGTTLWELYKGDATSHDDYLVSPLLDFPKAGYYEVKWRIKGGGTGYGLKSGIVTDKSDVAGSFTESLSITLSAGSYASAYTDRIHLDNAQSSAVALYAYPENNALASYSQPVRLEDVNVEYVPLTPKAPTGLTITPDPDNALKATLAWVNPTESNIKDAAPEITTVRISRKPVLGAIPYETVGTIEGNFEPGASMTWTDENVPAPGLYMYQIELMGSDLQVGSGFASLKSTWIGPGREFPVSHNMTQGDEGFMSADWAVHNVDGCTIEYNDDDWGSYEQDVTFEVQSNGIYITSNNAESTDDWAMSPYFQFHEGDRYKLTLKSSSAYGTPPVWTIWHATSQDYNDADIQMGQITTTGTPSSRQEDSFIIDVVTPEQAAALAAAKAEGDTAGEGEGDNNDDLTAEADAVVPAGKAVIGFHLNQNGVLTISGMKVEVIRRKVQSVSITDADAAPVEAAEITIGDPLQLNAVVGPEDATDKNVTWSSANESIATVDAAGLVTPVAVGETSITATCDGLSASVQLSVKPVVAESVTVSAESTALYPGDELQLTAVIAPENVTDKTLVWSSSDEEVATVSADGKVTAVAPGQATVTAACGEVSGSIDLTVNPRPAESITLNQTEIQAVEGTTVQLVATVLPENATDKTVTWSSSDEAVATVDENGLVSILKAGEADITAACGSLTAVCHVKALSGLSLIPADALDSVRFYNMKGIEVKNPELTPGFYIARYTYNGAEHAVKVRF